MYENYNIMVRINLLEHNSIKIGEGLRMALIAYNELQKQDILVDRLTLYNMLTDIHTFFQKKSFDHFYDYIINYLVNNGFLLNSHEDKDIFLPSNTSYYVVEDEFIMGQTLIPYKMFIYFYTEFWEQIVNYALYNFFEEPNNHSTQYFNIPFDEYSLFYDYKKFKSQDDITAKFLSDVSDFLSFNHILLLKDFEVSESNLDLSLPIKFDFRSIL